MSSSQIEGKLRGLSKADELRAHRVKGPTRIQRLSPWRFGLGIQGENHASPAVLGT